MQTMPAREKVFISYAREDESAARTLFEDLKRAGLDPWFDKEFLLPGQKWQLALQEAIRESRYFLALLSTRSVTKRGVVQKEIREALDVLNEFPEGDVFLVPVRLDDCRPPYQILHDLQWVDLFPTWDTGLRKLLDAVCAGKEDEKHRSIHRTCVAVCDFRNFSPSASEACIGERYSEYILQRLAQDIGSEIPIYGSLIGRPWQWQSSLDIDYYRSAIRSPINPRPGERFDVGITYRGQEKEGRGRHYNEIQGPNLILRDEIGIYIQPVRAPTLDLRDIVGKPGFSAQFDGCCVVAGSIEDANWSKFKALIRVIWISESNERTWLLEETSFDVRHMVENANRMSVTISKSIVSHLQ